MMKLSLRGMSDATRLTQSGRLMEATALIQRLLSNERPEAPSEADPQPWQALRLTSETGNDHVKTKKASAPTVARRRVEPKPAKKAAEFGNHLYSSALGERQYKLFVPSSRTGHSMPLVVMLHGCNQTPDDFAAGTQMNRLAEEMGFLVAYPAQPTSANMMGCWNWFKTSDQQKGRGEPALIAGIVEHIMASHEVDARRVYVAGLSAGGAMAAVLGMSYPEMFAAIGVHSGLPCGAASNLAGAMDAMKRGGGRSTNKATASAVPTIVFHGDGDRVVHPINAKQVVAQFLPADIEKDHHSQTGKSPGGMAYSHSVFSDKSGRAQMELWMLHGAGHAWSGGSSNGSYTEPKGPDASAEMIRFFLDQRLAD